MEEKINNLNNNEVSYIFTQPTIIEGTWRKDANAQGLLGGSSIDINYKITVTLNADNTYTYKENLAENNTKAKVSLSGGTLSFGGSSSKFSGKTFGMKKMGTTIHPGGSSDSNQYSYQLETTKIKQPLLMALQESGYQEKKGFFGKLFGK